MEKFLRDEWKIVNVLTAGDDAQKYIDEKMSAGKDALDSAMQATKEKVTAADEALEKFENDVSNLHSSRPPLDDWQAYMGLFEGWRRCN